MTFTRARFWIAAGIAVLMAVAVPAAAWAASQAPSCCSGCPVCPLC